MWPTMKYVSWMKMSTGVEAMKTPESPPMTNIATKARALSIGVVKWMSPPQTVPSQLNVLMAEGTAMTIVESMNVVPRIGFIPLMNMWWPQTMNPRPAIPHHRIDHRAVAEDGLAAEDGQDLRGDAHRRQDHDVDLGVAEEPEEVLPEEQLPAAGVRPRLAGNDHPRREEERGPERAVEEQHDERRREHG